MKARRKLRVAVLADSSLQPRWLVEAFATLADCDFAEIVAFAVRGSAQPTSPWLCRLGGSLDSRLFKSTLGGDLSERTPIAAAAPGARLATLADLRLLDLDVVFGLGNVAHLAPEGLAKHGFWYYGFGEDRDPSEPDAGVREVTDGAPVSRSALVARLPGDGGERIVYESASRTFAFSAARNRANLLRKTAQFPWRALRALHRSGERWLAECPIASPTAQHSGTGPGLLDCLREISSVGGRIARRGVEKMLYVDQWILAYRFGAGRLGRDEVQSFTRLVPPKDRFWADPFPFVHNQRYFIFFEDYVFSAGKGHIAVLEVAADGRASGPVPVLQRDYHLSYPHLIEDEGTLFMVPESGANRTVELYRCVEFPHRWALEKILLRDARYLDATIHRAGEKWWMFVTVAVPGTDGYDELHLYYADRLTGPWVAHEANPVKSDVHGSRPAGRLYEQGGALFRPAQICAPLYGSGLSINRVLNLSPENYAEHEEQLIAPGLSDGALGLHTLNCAGDLMVIDLFIRHPRFWQRQAVPSVPVHPSLPTSSVTRLADN
jgi:hypothetical protein